MVASIKWTVAGFSYKKTGARLYDIRPEGPNQESLFGSLCSEEHLTGRKEDKDLMVDGARIPSSQGPFIEQMDGSDGYYARFKDLPEGGWPIP
jgi:hypothetical protein